MNGAAVFGEALRKQRIARRLTQAELAEKAELSERAISDLERGLKHPQRASVRLLYSADRPIWQVRHGGPGRTSIRRLRPFVNRD